MVHRFRLGESVNLIGSPYTSGKGIYRVTELMPERDGEPQYRLKSESSDPSRECVAMENELGPILRFGSRG